MLRYLRVGILIRLGANAVKMPTPAEKILPAFFYQSFSKIGC
jgi:hypothetical protein